MIANLYEARSNRCGTCGRRFFATEEGKEKKARHLDWHFKTNQRMAEAAKRAQNRSWYVDERVSIHRSDSVPFVFSKILTRARIGSNPGKLATTKASRTQKLPEIVQLGLMVVQRRKPLLSNTSTLRTTQPCGIRHAPSVRRNSSRHGLKKFKIGSGKMR